MKIIKTFLIIVVILGIAGYIAYTEVVPRMATKAISTGKIPAIVPKKYHSAITETRKKVVEQVDALPEAMHEYKISYEDLSRFASEIKNDEVREAIKELNTTEISSSGEAFDIGLKHISADLPSANKFKALFESRFTVEDVEEELEKINNSELPVRVEIDMARRIGIELLKQKKEEINRKLDSLQAR